MQLSHLEALSQNLPALRQDCGSAGNGHLWVKAISRQPLGSAYSDPKDQ